MASMKKPKGYEEVRKVHIHNLRDKEIVYKLIFSTQQEYDVEDKTFYGRFTYFSTGPMHPSRFKLLNTETIIHIELMECPFELTEMRRE
jgi:hypothetical protein